MACSSMLERPEPVIGFCFSFPVEQASVNSGKLLRWTKGYTNPGAVGQDPAKLLAEAFRRKVTTNRDTDQTAQTIRDICICYADGSISFAHPTCIGCWDASRVESSERQWSCCRTSRPTSAR